MTTAILSGDLKLLRETIKTNKDLEAFKVFSGSALDTAINAGKTHIVKLLLEFETNTSSTEPVKRALLAQRADIAELLVHSGARLNMRESGLSWEEVAPTLSQLPLMAMVKFLLQAQGTLDFVDVGGRTPLWFAIQRQNRPLAQALIKAGARTDIAQSKGDLLHGLAHLNEMSDLLKVSAVPWFKHNPERAVLDSFRQYSDAERTRVLDERRQRARKDKSITLKDLKDFAQNFSLPTPIPDDIKQLLANDKGRQRETAEWARKSTDQKRNDDAEVEETPIETKQTISTPGSIPSSRVDLPRPPSPPIDPHPYRRWQPPQLPMIFEP